MANLQYVGARYVPKLFTNPDDGTSNWKSGISYENLTIVTYLDDSYTSKKPVPANIGNPAANQTYWVKTGNYNAALATLQNQISSLLNNAYVMRPTGDTTDRNLELTTALATHKAVLFDAGDFYFSGNISIPDKSKLFGLGVSSRIRATNTNGYLFNIGDDVEISSLKIDGGILGRPDNIGSADGLYLTGPNKKCKISNCNIEGFHGRAVHCEGNGGDVTGSLNIVNCLIRYNGIAMELGEDGEYALINNCTFTYNNHGVHANGGNNRFTACNFGYHIQAAIIDGNGVLNSAHGQFIGCSFNHNIDALKIQNTINGEDVIGCLFYPQSNYDIEVIDALGGINIESCQFGSGAAISMTGAATQVNLANNVFRDVPSINYTNIANIHGLNNTLENGTPVATLNQSSRPVSPTTLTKTYEANAYVTESSFNNQLTAIKVGSLLFIQSNFTVTDMPSGSWITIGNLGTTLLQQVYSIAFDGTNRVLLSLEANGDVRLYGYTPSTITMSVFCSLTVPLSVT